MLKNFLGNLSLDIGIDLGTTNTLVYVKNRGVIINEPSIVAIDLRTDTLLAVGHDAELMLGKTPAYIKVVKPLKHGIISDFEVAEKMIKHFVDKAHRETKSLLPRPKLVISIPMEITEVERKAVEDASLSAGARTVYLVEKPMAAAVGARLPIQDPSGQMIVDLGGGTTEIALISLSGIVSKKSLPIAGEELTTNITKLIRENFNLVVGDKTSEDIKLKIGSTYPLQRELEYKLQGRDLLKGLPKNIIITSPQIRESIKKSIDVIINHIKITLESSPPELVRDVYKQGVLLSGGGSMLRGLNLLMQKELQIPVTIIEDPLTAVVRGTGMILEKHLELKDIIVPSTKI